MNRLQQLQQLGITFVDNVATIGDHLRITPHEVNTCDETRWAFILDMARIAKAGTELRRLGTIKIVR